MKKIRRYGALPVAILLLLTLFAVLIRNGNMELLNPQGYIADLQSRILWIAFILSFLIALSLIGTVFFMVFHYREDNTHVRYEPNRTVKKRTIVVWFLAPLAAIIVISGFLWSTAHATDQYKPIPSSAAPLHIQVVALQWNWLFIYPQQHIATVNFLEFPVNTPLDFELTSDAPMNSFWIPSLGSQIYEMPGMSTQLHLMANTIGNFQGRSAQISGAEFANMVFDARSVSNANFTAWVQTAKNSTKQLDFTTYSALAQPSSNYPPATYVLTDTNLYNQIMMKDMMPPQTPMAGGT
jgi:cytochrome o ubiquinol oxidase subunit 2